MITKEGEFVTVLHYKLSELPQYAQDHIAELNAEIKRLQERCDKLQKESSAAWDAATILAEAFGCQFPA